MFNVTSCSINVGKSVFLYCLYSAPKIKEGVEVKRHLRRLPHLSLCSKQDQLELVSQILVYLDFEYLHEWRLYGMSGQLVPIVCSHSLCNIFCISACVCCFLSYQSMLPRRVRLHLLFSYLHILIILLWAFSSLGWSVMALSASPHM